MNCDGTVLDKVIRQQTHRHTVIAHIVWLGIACERVGRRDEQSHHRLQPLQVIKHNFSHNLRQFAISQRQRTRGSQIYFDLRFFFLRLAATGPSGTSSEPVRGELVRNSFPTGSASAKRRKEKKAL
jgi:hypothetical protein